MSEVRYRVGTVGGRVAKKRPLEEGTMLDRVREVLSSHSGKWQIRRRGEHDWSGARDREGTSDRLGELIARGDIGEAWQFRPEDTPAAVYVVRRIEVAPPVTAPSVGSSALKDIHIAYFEHFGGHESWGIFNCRPIAGSTSWSQHAWGNAEDFSDAGVAAEEAEGWFNANRTKLPFAEIIGRGRIWTKARASEGWRALSSSANQHQDHWHVSAHPLMSGTPPCAPQQ
jgi:hypothetical protein